MIYGIGTDLCDVRRIAAAVERRGLRFAQRVLGEHELEVYLARQRAVPLRGLRYLATRFAAKEAFSKAIGLGLHSPMSWRRCEIVKAKSGKPEVVLHGELAHWFAQRGLSAQVSVTDESDYALAFVIVEQSNPTAEGNRP